MKKRIALALLMASCGGNAQTGGGFNSDVERARISADRSKLEASLAIEETACYKRFWVKNCLDEVKVKRRDALEDFRRQEIVVNTEVHRRKAAVQLKKIEDKSSPEKLQQDADQRAQAVKDFQNRMARDKQQAADREVLQAGEKAKSDATAGRIKDNQTKAAGRSGKQAQEAEERKKYNERLDQAKERQARYAREKASQTKAPAKPLPLPN